MSEVTDVAALSDDELRRRFATLQEEHRAALARRSGTRLGSEEFIAAQRAVAGVEVRMNEISGILAERAGRGHVAVAGRDS